MRRPGGRYAISRQKSCQPCSAAKAKCDRRQICSRCAQRGYTCTYGPASAPKTRVSIDAGDHGRTPTSGAVALPVSGMPPTPGVKGTQRNSTIVPKLSFASDMVQRDANVCPVYGATAEKPPSPERTVGYIPPQGKSPLDFSSLQLICPIPSEDIQNRWLNQYVPIPGQKTKDYPSTVTAFLYRMLKAYTSAAVHGEAPAFVHPLQLEVAAASGPLRTCLDLIRTCGMPLDGSESVASDGMKMEMGRIYDEYRSFNVMDLLAAFQAFLLYSMTLFFKMERESMDFLRPAMMQLQDIACLTSRQGLLCRAEHEHRRPQWEEWIVCESKRRTLFTMYLFDSLLSAQDNTPTYMGTELEGLPAPADRFRWRSQSRDVWEDTYDQHLVNWPEGGLRIDELWPVPEEQDDAGVGARRRRVDQWLEGIDEFGTMLYAVTSCTHGS